MMKSRLFCSALLMAHVHGHEMTGDDPGDTGSPPIQKPDLPQEVEAIIRHSGRHPLPDADRDGRDDLRGFVYRRSGDGRSVWHLRSEPEGDAAGDGADHDPEMPDFRNPRRADVPAKAWTREEARLALAAAKEVRESDRAKISRFHALLEERGVLVRPAAKEDGKDRRPEREDAGEEAGEESSFFPGVPGDDDAGIELSMWCRVGGPQILATARLSSGQYLLAWEGDPEKLYDIEWSDDLVRWHGGGAALPTLAGTGTWGQTALSEKRFFRVVEDAASSTLPSDPSGGDGVNTFGGAVSIDSEGVLATVTVHLPEHLEPIVWLNVDGEFYSYCGRQRNGTYGCFLNRERLTAGIHGIHAVIEYHCATTESPENPQAPVYLTLRTPEVVFENVWQGLTGLGTTEAEIHSGEEGSPSSTRFHVEYPLFAHPGGLAETIEYALRIYDDHGTQVRYWEGILPGPGPGRLVIEWDGTGPNGTTLPGGPYRGQFYFRDSSGSGTWNEMTHEELLTVQNGPADFRLLALGESMATPPDGGWTASRIQKFRPEWWKQKGSSGGPANTGAAWGPWVPLGSGPTALVGGLQTYMDPAGARRMQKQADDGMTEQEFREWKIRIGERAKSCSVRSWVSNGRFNDARPWAGTNQTPAQAFATGNPFNAYDAGFLIGHGVASAASSYRNEDEETVVLPSQHYFPFLIDKQTGGTAWIRSGQMAEKFGAAGSRLRWMCVVTCNYLRVAGHHSPATHDIWDDMKASKTLPIGPGLRVLCSYTTSVDVTGKLGHAFAKGVMGHEPEDGNMTVVDAWTYAWENSENGSDKSYTNPGEPKQIRNARSVYWPECRNDIISAKTKMPANSPNGPYDQSRLLTSDSNYPNP